MSTANYERSQLLPSQVIWDGIIDRIEVFRNFLKVIMSELALDIYLNQVSRELISREALNVMVIFLMKYLLLPIEWCRK
jgi:hypothetical protein